MLIHSYLTDGFFDFGQALLLSFKQHHGEEIPFFLTTRNLSEKQIDHLHFLYGNLIVSNEQIDMQALSERAGRSVEELKKLKWQVEKVFVKPKSIVWKQFVSVEDRYRDSLQDAFNIAGDCFLHLDVDSFIHQSLDPLFRIIEQNDVSLVFRPTKAVQFKIFGCVMGFKVNTQADKFLETWRKYIDAIPLAKKPRGYGQTSCWKTYAELRDSDIQWGRIPKSFIQTGFRSNVLIVQGNNGYRKHKVAANFLRRV